MVIFNKKQQGFSLIELMVVISIIATLTAILLPNFMGARERARDTQKIQDLNSMKNALRTYYNDFQAYPTGTVVGVSNVGGTLTPSFASYMPGVSDFDYTYSYYMKDNGETFNLCVGLDSGQGSDDTSSQSKCGAMTTGVCNLSVGITQDKLFVVCAK